MERLRTAFAVALVMLGASIAALGGDAPAADVLAPMAATPLSCPLTMDGLLSMDRASLESLYRSAAPGTPPVGVFAGKATPAPGTSEGLRKSKVIGVLWKGKVISEDVMVNRLPFGVRAVKADVYTGESFLDGRPSTILDYANTSRLFRADRDEVREVAPGLYLGLTYVRKCPTPKLAMVFALQTLSDCPNLRGKGNR
jgi:hypothetical protein